MNGQDRLNNLFSRYVEHHIVHGERLRPYRRRSEKQRQRQRGTRDPSRVTHACKA